MDDLNQALATIDLFLAAVWLVLLIILEKRKVDQNNFVLPKAWSTGELKDLENEFDQIILGPKQTSKKKRKP